MAKEKVMTKHFATIDGIKRAAIKHKRLTSVPHHEALEFIAREAGHSSFHAARQFYDGKVGTASTAAPTFPVTIYQFWSVRRERRRGNEARTFHLDKPLTALLGKQHMCGYFGGVTMRDEQTLIGYSTAENQDHARQNICRLARALQFVSATGLKPTRSVRCYPKGEWNNRPPGADHDESWYDPATRSFLLTTEPYPGKMERHTDAREGWLRKFGWGIVQSRWASIYGHGTELYLSARSTGPLDLAAIETRLAQLPPPFEEGEWPEKEVIAQ
jgi:hypothetical protein